MNLDVGMGKTVIAILLALQHTAPPPDSAPLSFKGTVFVAPPHLVPQWERDIRRFAPAAALVLSLSEAVLGSADIILVSRACAEEHKCEPLSHTCTAARSIFSFVDPLPAVTRPLHPPLSAGLPCERCACSTTSHTRCTRAQCSHASRPRTSGR